MSKKLNLDALDKLMKDSRDSELSDHEPHTAAMKIEGDPDAVQAVTDKLGVPGPREMSDGMTSHHDDDGEDEHEGPPHEHVVSALKQHFPDVHRAVMKKLGHH